MAHLFTLAKDLETAEVREHRARTTDAVAIFDIGTLQRALIDENGKKYLKALEQIKIFIDPSELRCMLLEGPNTLPVRLAVQKQHRGQRLFWVCPISGERTRLIYLVATTDGPVIGSRKALGLVYPSQALHRTPVFDNAVVSGVLKASNSVLLRASWRRRKRFHKALMQLV